MGTGEGKADPSAGKQYVDRILIYSYKKRDLWPRKAPTRDHASVENLNCAGKENEYEFTRLRGGTHGGDARQIYGAQGRDGVG